MPRGQPDRGGRWDQLGPKSSPGEVGTTSLCRPRRRHQLRQGLTESPGSTRGSDNKDIHYTRRGFFSARNERLCVLYDPPRVCFSVCKCVVLPGRSSRFPPCDSRFTRADGLAREARLKCDPGKARGRGIFEPNGISRPREWAVF